MKTAIVYHDEGAIQVVGVDPDETVWLLTRSEDEIRLARNGSEVDFERAPMDLLQAADAAEAWRKAIREAIGA